MKTFILVALLFLTLACGKQVDPNDPNRDGGEVYLFSTQGHCGPYGLKLVGDTIEAYESQSYTCQNLLDTIEAGETKTVLGRTFQVDKFHRYLRVRVN